MEEKPIHNTYTPAAKERLRRYREKHKEKVNQINNDFYHRKMEDPEYKQKLRDQAKARYHRRKAEKEAQLKLEEENKAEEAGNK